jgi:hypothetical protein
MRNSLARGLLCVAFGLALARAQTATPVPEATHAPEATGSVSGHVYCADTNQPARLAVVTLQSAPRKIGAGPPKQVGPDSQSVPPTVRTGLDGSFFFPRIKPGTYFLITDYAGYVSPIAKLSPEEVRSKEPSDIQKIEKALVQIAVAANKDSAQDIQLERGAAISGTIRYDDGSPANGLEAMVLRRGDDGKMSPVSLNLSGQMRVAMAPPTAGLETNDLGHYRISGLPPGKYVLQVTLPTTIYSYGGLLGGLQMDSFRIDDSVALSVYSGNVFREKDSKPIEIASESEHNDVDITIPLLGLHAVSGSITALSDGQPIEKGIARLLFADDKTELLSFFWGSSSEGRFNFRFVPEGEYILHVEGTDGYIIESVQAETGITNPERKALHSYSSVDQPISVHSDLSNVNISLPDKPADKSSATAQKQ